MYTVLLIMLPQDVVVCTKRWQDVFDTETYELTCTSNPIDSNDKSQGIDYSISRQQYQNSYSRLVCLYERIRARYMAPV